MIFHKNIFTCVWNPVVLPLKWHFVGRTFALYYLFLRILLEFFLVDFHFPHRYFYLIICKTIETTILNSNDKLSFRGPFRGNYRLAGFSRNGHLIPWGIPRCLRSRHQLDCQTVVFPQESVLQPKQKYGLFCSLAPLYSRAQSGHGFWLFGMTGTVPNGCRTLCQVPSDWHM